MADVVPFLNGSVHVIDIGMSVYVCGVVGLIFYELLIVIVLINMMSVP